MKIDGLAFLETTRRMPLMQLPVRSSVVELEGARLLVSPASTLTQARLGELGPITDIVSPTLFHTEGMATAAAAHPKARLWGPVGIREKRPDLT